MYSCYVGLRVIVGFLVFTEILLRREGCIPEITHVLTNFLAA